MTKKQFYSLRRQVIKKMMDSNREKGLDYSYKHLDRMPRPDFTKIHSYQEAWDMLLPLREALNFKVQ